MATTLAAIRQYLGPLMGEFITGTPAAGGTTTVFTCAALAGRYNPDKFNGRYGRFYAGTLAGNTFRVDDYVGTTASFTIVPAMSGSIAATDLFEIFPMGYEAENLDSKINLAIQSVENVATTPVYDEATIIHSLLSNGAFETFSTTFTGWTADSNSAVTQETSIIREGASCCKIVTDGTNLGSMTQSVANWPRFVGKSLTLYAFVSTATADRCRLSLTDGVSTEYSDYHTGAGWLRGSASPYLYTTTLTPATTASELTAVFNIDAGSAVTAYLDRMWLADPSGIFEYSVPSGFNYIGKIIQEDQTIGHFNEANGLVDPNGWRMISDGTTPKVVFDPAYTTLKAGRALQLVGQARASTLSSDTATTEINPAYVAWQAKAYLHAAKITDDSESSKQHGKQMLIAEQMASRYKPSNPPMGRMVHW